MRVAGAMVSLVLVGVCADAADTVMVLVYRDHFEINGRVLASIDQVREATQGLAISYSVRECGAKERVRELGELFAERAQGRPYDVMRDRFPLQCEEPKE